MEPLPHQITVVYSEMLPRQPLRFLLADDPGAGKTIMAALLGKVARDLAYRLYATYEHKNKKLVKEALAYNSLVIA